MRFLVLDFETKDPYIGLELGAGWCFAVNYPHASLFYPIGYSYSWYDAEDNTFTAPKYIALSTKRLLSIKGNIDNTGLMGLEDLIKEAKNIVCHNAQYDLGCLRSLGISIKHLRVYDTKVMAQLYDSNLWSYSLSSLLTKYGLGTKQTGSLGDIVKRFELLKTPRGTVINPETKTFSKRANDFAYSNMDLLQELDFSTVAFYANHDVLGTVNLFKMLYPKVGDKLSHFYSNIQKICVDIREPGITVDLDATDKAIEILQPEVNRLEQSLFKRLGKEINLHSVVELPQALESLGYVLNRTEKGNPSVDKDFIEDNPLDPLCQELGKYRSLYMLLNTFSIKIKDMQKYSCPDVQGGTRIGRVFPEMNLLQARTGRSSSSNPNIQNIPNRDKEYAKLCRSMFIPTNSNTRWYSLDWSNQEGRLQLHYSVLKNFSRAKEWLTRFIENPNLDTHSIVAEMMGGVDRNIAKTIYLGKSYCMGKAKTATRLGLPTETVDYGRGPMLTSGKEASKLIDLYEKAFPYLSELQKDCIEVIRTRGSITTIGGRKLLRDRAVGGRDFDYKAISKLIQGSASDQMYKALTIAHEEGLNIKCIVHDEFNIEGNEKDAKRMKEIMETCVELKVPSVAEIKVGSSWGSLTKLEEESINVKTKESI